MRPRHVTSAAVLSAFALCFAAGCGGSGKGPATASQAEADAGVRACVTPGATSTAASGAVPDWPTEKQCLEADARSTSDPARKRADELELAKGQKEAEGGQNAVARIETKAEADSTTPAWSPSSPERSTAYTEQEMAPAGAEGVLSVDLKALGEKFHGGTQLGQCLATKLGISNDSRVVGLLIALHDHEGAADQAVAAHVQSCGG